MKCNSCGATFETSNVKCKCGAEIMENKDTKTNTFDDILKIIILVPLGIGFFSWVGVGSDIIIEQVYLFFKNSLVFRELFDIASSLYNDSVNNPLVSMSVYKTNIVYLMLLFICLPTLLLFYLILSLIKKVFNKDNKQQIDESKSQQNVQ